jgi:hypothetical protein
MTAQGLIGYQHQTTENGEASSKCEALSVACESITKLSDASPIQSVARAMLDNRGTRVDCAFMCDISTEYYPLTDTLFFFK